MCKPSRRASYTANPRGTKFRNYRHAVKPVMALDASIMSDTVQVLFTVYTSSKVLYVKPIALTCEYPART